MAPPSWQDPGSSEEPAEGGCDEREKGGRGKADQGGRQVCCKLGEHTCVAAPGPSGDPWHLWSLLQPVGSLVAACELFAEARGT